MTGRWDREGGVRWTGKTPKGEGEKWKGGFGKKCKGKEREGEKRDRETGTDRKGD